MTEASLCKIAHPGLQCKIINRLSLLPSSKEPTIGRVTAPTPPTLKRLKPDRLMHPTAPVRAALESTLTRAVIFSAMT